MKEIKKWKIDYRANSSEEMGKLEEKVALLQNHSSPMNPVRGTNISSYDIVVQAGRNNVTKVVSSGDPLKFYASGKDGKSADLTVFVEPYGDGSLRYDVTINGNRYWIGTCD